MSIYEDKLNILVDQAIAIRGSGGHRAFTKIINGLDLPRDPIGEMIYTLDDRNFKRVIDLLTEFRQSGYREDFNTLHRTAIDRLNEAG